VSPSLAGEPVVHVSGLTRRFGPTTALDSVSLSLPRGAVYGLVGANGAGKTTLIKHLLGLLRAERGEVRVFGHEPVADPVAVLSRIGYLSEENDLPGWMRVDELIRYSRAFYPAWDDGYAEELRQAFALDHSAKIRTLSKGQRARAGLLIANLLDLPSTSLVIEYGTHSVAVAINTAGTMVFAPTANRTYTIKATAELVNILDVLVKKSASGNQPSVFSEITDDDIDNLFND